jgi:hypothetical protein
VSFGSPALFSSLFFFFLCVCVVVVSFMMIDVVPRAAYNNICGILWTYSTTDDRQTNGSQAPKPQIIGPNIVRHKPPLELWCQTNVAPPFLGLVGLESSIRLLFVFCYCWQDLVNHRKQNNG